MRRFLILLSAALLAACSTTPEVPVVAGGSLAREREAPAIGTGEEVPEPDLLDPNRVVARVNDQTITVRSITAAAGVPEGPPELVRAALDNYTMRLIADRLFLEAADRAGITVTKADLENVRRGWEREAAKRGTTLDEDLALRGVPVWEWEEEQRRQILKEKYLRLALGQMQPISAETRAAFDTFVRPAEVREYFERHRDEYRQKEEAKLEGVYVQVARFDGDAAKARAYAEDVVARGRGETDFSELVAEVQGDRPLPMFEKPFDRSQRFAAPEVSEFAWSAPVGSVSDPIPLANGWLVVKLVRRQVASEPELDDVREQVENELYSLKMRIGSLKLQLDLLREAVVTPRRYKDAIRAGLGGEVARALERLHG